ncbi:MAG: ester cyclase [Dehalococcoidia bacterium]
MGITKDDVTVAVQAWIAAINEPDIAAICAMDATGYGFGYRTSAPRDMSSTSIDKYREFMRGFYDRHKGIVTTLEELQTAVDGDVGLAWGVYTEQFQIAGRPLERARVRFSQTMRRDQDGAWRFLLFHRDIQPFDDQGRYPPSLNISDGDQRFRQFIIRFVEAENDADLEALSAMLAPDVEVWLNGALVRTGRDAQVEATRANLAAFPDWRRKIESISFDGNLGALRWTGEGTHKGTFAGIQATGRRISFSGTSWAELENGVAKRIWIDMDMAGPFAQMTGRPDE